MMENENRTDFTREELESAKEERRRELERTYSHDGYLVIRKELFAHQCDPAMTIRDRSITFNTACINGFEDVVWIKVMINEDLKRIAITPCDENDKDAVRWCVAKPDKRKSRNITCPDLSDKIYALMGWDKAYRYKMLGYHIHPNGEEIYIFDLLVSERTKNGARRRKDAIQPEEALEPIEAESDGDNDATATVDKEAETSETVKSFEDKFPEAIAGSFGVSVEQHKQDTAVTEINGYVTAALLTGSNSEPRE